jgi:hypothetical protein
MGAAGEQRSEMLAQMMCVVSGPHLALKINFSKRGRDVLLENGPQLADNFLVPATSVTILQGDIT